jgi:hypothetical protein
MRASRKNIAELLYKISLSTLAGVGTKFVRHIFSSISQSQYFQSFS